MQRALLHTDTLTETHEENACQLLTGLQPVWVHLVRNASVRHP